MTYRVIILPRAKRQLLEQALWWSRHRSFETRKEEVVIYAIRHLAQRDLAPEEI